MNSVCPICGKEFDPHATSNKPRKYCNHECYRLANIKHVNEKKKIRDEEARLEWAKDEARYLGHLAHEWGLNELTDYIYNNYKPRRKTK